MCKILLRMTRIFMSGSYFYTLMVIVQKGRDHRYIEPCIVNT